MAMSASLKSLFDNPALKLQVANDLVKSVPEKKPEPELPALPETCSRRRQQTLQTLLASARLQEWFLQSGLEGPAGGVWFAPLTLLVVAADVACRALARRRVYFIGDACSPGIELLQCTFGNTLEDCIFVSASTVTDRFWAIDQTLRCPATAAVIADAGGCDAAMSRRLLLAAESGGGVGLLARPPWEQRGESSAMLRWLLRPEPSPVCLPRWRVTLTRCKNQRWSPADPRTWVVQWSPGNGHGTLDLCDEPAHVPPARQQTA